MWAEAISPVLVSRRTGAPVPDVVAASTAKRWLLVRIGWDSANVLKIETDWGQQTRFIRFDQERLYGDIQQDLMMGVVPASSDAPSLQGRSTAMWERPYQINANIWTRGPTGRGGGLGTIRQGEQQPGGSMAVLTTNLSGGWLRRNGVPYSARTRVI